jgi:molybdopterin synthase catalytic subunit
MVAINAFGVSAMMTMIKAEAGDISALAKDNPLRLAFAFWHGIGSVMQLISTLFLVVLVMKSQRPKAKSSLSENSQAS